MYEFPICILDIGFSRNILKTYNVKLITNLKGI